MSTFKDAENKITLLFADGRTYEFETPEAQKPGGYLTLIERLEDEVLVRVDIDELTGQAVYGFLKMFIGQFPFACGIEYEYRHGRPTHRAWYTFCLPLRGAVLSEEGLGYGCLETWMKHAMGDLVIAGLTSPASWSVLKVQEVIRRTR